MADGLSTAAVVNLAGGSGDKDGRDSWCTPLWLAELMGWFDLDPCNNARSHILHRFWCSLEDGGNGLVEDNGDGIFGPGCFAGRCKDQFDGELQTNYAPRSWRVFINPPYARGQVKRWVRHYSHTNFVYLLRWDPSTDWFAELMKHTKYVWFPNRRINFEPPPGVKSSSNPFPHALYMAAKPDGNLLTNGYTLQTNHTPDAVMGGN